MAAYRRFASDLFATPDKRDPGPEFTPGPDFTQICSIDAPFRNASPTLHPRAEVRRPAVRSA